MKLQNLNFFEKHVEKLALAVGALLLLVLGGYYVLGSPFGAEVANRRATSPSGIEQPIEEAARRLQGELGDSQAISAQQRDQLGQDPWQIPDYVQSFDGQWQQIQQQPTELAGSFGQQGLSEDMLPAPPEEPYDVPTPPLASNLQAYSNYAMVREDAVANLDPQTRQRYFEDGPPHEIWYASVSGTFNPQQWIDNFDEVPEAARVPEDWRLPLITGVYLQRQTLNPDTGQWENTTRIGPMPNQPVFLSDSEREWSPSEAQQTIQTIIQLNRASNQLLRPAFFPLANQSWRPPSQVEQRQRIEQDIDGQRERNRADARRRLESVLNQLRNMLDRGRAPEAQVARLERRWNRTWQRYIRFSDEFDSAPAMPEVPSADQGEQGGGGEPRRGGGPEAGMRGPGEGNRPANERPGNNRRGNNQPGANQPGGNRPGGNQPGGNQPPREFAGPAGGAGAEGSGQPGMNDGFGRGLGSGGSNPWQQRQWDLESPGESGAVRVWAHDPTIEPGNTYRYRIIVAVLNPLFQKRAVPAEQREANYHKIALVPNPAATQADGWSNPVRVRRNRRFFLVGARPQRRSATIQVWRLQGGQWYHKDFTHRPGDPIGGSKTLAPANGLNQGGGDDGAAGPNAGGPAGPGDNASGDGGGGPRPQPAEAEGGQAAPVNNKPAERSINMRVGATLVDIKESPATGFNQPLRRIIYRPDDRNELLERELEADQTDPWRLYRANRAADIPGRLEKLEQLAQQARQEAQQPREGGGPGEVRF